MPLYGIIDCARDPRLIDMVRATPDHQCMFAGNLAEPLARTAPHIVKLSTAPAFKQLWESEGWGQSWGILCRSPLDLAEVRRHLRHFLQAKLPDGTVVLFRFFDPRVWRVYWPSCSEEEQQKWLKNVDEFIAEPESEPV